jgi:Tfp pilus assembly protein PilF
MTKFLRCALILVSLVFSTTPLRADSIPEIVAKAKPAVVEIVTTNATRTPKTLGTGFFISPDGLVVTNQHVIKGADSITAVSNNGAIFLLERVVAQPVGVDLVVLKFHALDVPFLKLGGSTVAVEGQKVIVIGNPTGLMGTVSDGIISAFRENRSLIQITAPISPGSSGSPVMDENGQVIGVATLQSVEGQNLNFAIPVEQVLSAPLVQLLTGLPFSGETLPSATLRPANNAKPYFDSGLAYLGSKDFDKAISDLTEAIRLDPNSFVAYAERGWAYFVHSDYDKAISDYNDVIRLDPNNTSAYDTRGTAYEIRGNLDKAISDFTEEIRINQTVSGRAHAYHKRGFAYGKRGDLDKAISDYNEAIRLDPNHDYYYYNRGNAYADQGKLDAAISNYT